MERGGHRGRGDRGRGGYGGGRGRNQYQDQRFSGEWQVGDGGFQPNYGGYGRGGGEESARGGYGGRGRGRGGYNAYPRDQGWNFAANEGGDGYGRGRGSYAGGGGGGGRGRQQLYQHQQYQQQDQRVSGDVRAQAQGIPATRHGGEDVRSGGGYGGRGGGERERATWRSAVSQTQASPARPVPAPNQGNNPLKLSKPCNEIVKT